MRNGLQGFANSVRLDDALRALEAATGIRLSHGSIYGRIWDDQRDFQLDVVATTIARYDGADVAEAVAAAVADPAVGPTTPAAEVVEVAFRAAVVASGHSIPFHVWIGARSAALTTPGTDDDERLAAALASSGRALEASLARALAPVPDVDGAGLARLLLTLLVGTVATGADDDAVAALRTFVG